MLFCKLPSEVIKERIDINASLVVLHIIAFILFSKAIVTCYENTTIRIEMEMARKMNLCMYVYMPIYKLDNRQSC